MRLYLSSQGLGDHIESLLRLMGPGRRVAYIENAKDYLTVEERRSHIDEKRVEFEQQGLSFEELDLRDYFGHPEKLLNKLSNFDLVWGSGGNSFILRRAYAQSGLDKILEDLPKTDLFVYGGSSAGSMVAGISLKGSEHGDEPDRIPPGYNEPIIWEGLKLVRYYFIPHYKSDWYGHDFGDMAVEYMQKHKLPYKALRDGQVLIINGDKEEFLK